MEVLAADEKNDVFVYIATNEKLESLKFGTNRRQRFAETVLDRFVVAGGSLRHCRLFDAIDFETTKSAVIVGVGLYGGEKGSAHDVTLEVLQGDKILIRTVRRMVSVGDKAPIRVDFETAVWIRQNLRYTLRVTMLGPKTWWGYKGVATYDLEGCGTGIVSFYQSAVAEKNNGSNIQFGQIPQLIFVVPSK